MGYLLILSCPPQHKQNATLKLKVGDEVFEEEGTIFTEATFINV